MLSSFLITSRETLEAALVVGVVLAYLNKTNNNQYKKTVYFAILAGIALSVFTAFAFNFLAGGFEGKSEELFEGIIMLLAAFLLTTMILWMLKQQQFAKKIEDKVAYHISNSYNNAYAIGLFVLIMLAVLREGVETVIFFGALNYSSGISFIGGLLGIIVAIGIGYLFFIGTKKINLRQVFATSSVLLILIAAGLVAHGIHELQEAGVLPFMVQEVWNINPEQNADGSYPALHEKGIVGSFFASLFGYNGNPSALEIISYAAYVLLIFYLYQKFSSEKKSLPKKTAAE